MTFAEEILAGIPADRLPEPKPYDAAINHAPKRKDILTPEEKVLALKNALRAYQRLNARAIEKVAPGGFIFTFSCSQVVDKEAFALTVFSAAASTGRRVRIIDRLNQPADHAVNIYHPEGEYLKGLLLYVE